MTTTNEAFGEGQHSHEVPSADLRAVFMRDAHHEGTLVTRVAAREEFVFASLDSGEIYCTPRCALVQLITAKRGLGCGREWTDFLPDDDIYACDLDSPDGLALIGLDLDDEIDSALGVVLWDSAR